LLRKAQVGAFEVKKSKKSVTRCKKQAHILQRRGIDLLRGAHGDSNGKTLNQKEDPLGKSRNHAKEKNKKSNGSTSE